MYGICSAQCLNAKISDHIYKTADSDAILKSQFYILHALLKTTTKVLKVLI